MKKCQLNFYSTFTILEMKNTFINTIIKLKKKQTYNFMSFYIYHLFQQQILLNTLILINYFFN